jgi:hypothetical protein
MLTIESQNAMKIKSWFETRGGIAVWQGLNLSNIRQMITPLHDEEGKRYTKPSWDMPNEPSEIITDISQVQAGVDKEVRRFHVAVRRSSNGFAFKCTDASSAKIRAAVEKAGDGAYHKFDYETQEAVIYKQESTVPLSEYKE